MPVELLLLCLKKTAQTRSDFVSGPLPKRLVDFVKSEHRDSK